MRKSRISCKNITDFSHCSLCSVQLISKISGKQDICSRVFLISDFCLNLRADVPSLEVPAGPRRVLSALGPAQGAGHVRCRGAAVAGRAGVWGGLNRGGDNQPAHGRVSRGGLRGNSGDPLAGLAKGCRWSSAGAGAGVAGCRYLAELRGWASLVLRKDSVWK